MTAPRAQWRKLPISVNELCIATVLRCGQSFRWKNAGDEWSCALNGRILTLRQDSTHLHYRAIFPSSASPSPAPDSDILSFSDDDKENDTTAALLHDYFNLSVNLTSLYAHWSAVDPNFSLKAPKFAGVRMLRQDPWENVISFICSSNNNISRISQMIDNLCLTFGRNLGNLDNVHYYDFPEPSELVKDGAEQKLRDLGFGYRAKYIHQTALTIVNDRPAGWLQGLRKVPYKEAHEALLELSGVGPKVSDCVCLMSLDKSEAVPVDTHVWQIALRDYKFGKGKNKTLTKAIYDAVGDHFRELWGKEAGWAHSVLFTADLKSFSERLVKVEETTTTTTTITTTSEGSSKAITKAINKRKVKMEAKTEDTEEVVKEEMEASIKAVKEETNPTKQPPLTRKKVKVEVREFEFDELALGEVTMSAAERVKRRRRGAK
ncbi:8-oxoguanine glycosylase ogg1 [Rhizina undulata]